MKTQPRYKRGSQTRVPYRRSHTRSQPCNETRCIRLPNKTVNGVCCHKSLEPRLDPTYSIRKHHDFAAHAAGRLHTIKHPKNTPYFCSSFPGTTLHRLNRHHTHRSPACMYWALVRTQRCHVLGLATLQAIRGHSSVS